VTGKHVTLFCLSRPIISQLLIKQNVCLRSRTCLFI